jgi:hypothetical protein
MGLPNSQVKVSLLRNGSTFEVVLRRGGFYQPSSAGSNDAESFDPERSSAVLEAAAAPQQLQNAAAPPEARPQLQPRSDLSRPDPSRTAKHEPVQAAAAGGFTPGFVHRDRPGPANPAIPREPMPSSGPVAAAPTVSDRRAVFEPAAAAVPPSPAPPSDPSPPRPAPAAPPASARGAAPARAPSIRSVPLRATLGRAAPYCGIGLYIEQGAKGCRVAGIEPGSAAELSGQIHVGDFFLKARPPPPPPPPPALRVHGPRQHLRRAEDLEEEEMGEGSGERSPWLIVPGNVTAVRRKVTGATLPGCHGVAARS